MKTKQDCGSAMLQWHGSQSDPVYAVGSYFISNMDYPKVEVVEDAKRTIDVLERGPSNLRSDDDIMELRSISKFLEEYIKEHKRSPSF